MFQVIKVAVIPVLACFPHLFFFFIPEWKCKLKPPTLNDEIHPAIKNHSKRALHKT